MALVGIQSSTTGGDGRPGLLAGELHERHGEADGMPSFKQNQGGEEESTPLAEERQSPQPRREGACLICSTSGQTPFRALAPSSGLSAARNHEMMRGQQ